MILSGEPTEGSGAGSYIIVDGQEIELVYEDGNITGEGVSGYVAHQYGDVYDWYPQIKGGGTIEEIGIF